MADNQGGPPPARPAKAAAAGAKKAPSAAPSTSNGSSRLASIKPVVPAVSSASAAGGSAPKKAAPIFTPRIPTSTSSSSSTAANTQQKRKEFTPRPPFQPRTGGPHRGGRGGFRGGRGGGGGWYSVKGSQGTASAQSTSVDASGDIEQPVMPRVMQPRYAEEDIAPTAASMQVDPKNPTHPITLPFMNPHSFRKMMGGLPDAEPAPPTDDMEIDLNADVPAKPAPPSSSEDGSRQRPADLLFRTDDGDYYGQDQIFFVQLPAALPVTPPPPVVAPAPAPAPAKRTAVQRDDMDVDGEVKEDPAPTAAPVRVQPKPGEMDDILGFRSTLSSMPSGKFGKIRLYKSGKVRLVIGGVEYDVSTGMTCNFLQEAVAIDQNKLYQIGEISKRMVCYPVVEDLLQAEHSPETVVVPDD